jgi:hypothetical protein
MAQNTNAAQDRPTASPYRARISHHRVAGEAGVLCDVEGGSACAAVLRLSATRKQFCCDVDSLRHSAAGALSMGLKRSRMACSKHGALKEMACSPVGPNRVQTEEKKRGLAQRTLNRVLAPLQRRSSADRLATMKCDEN